MTRVVVYHALYGCDTGCCGHVIELDGKEVEFEFHHPYGLTAEEDLKDWARQLARHHLGEEHVADLDWANCRIVDD
jgi:hypothetical protein